MKKAVLFFILMLHPVSVFALSPLSDEELANISGQSGVSIMPNITMSLHIDVIAWGDSDGLGIDYTWGLRTTGGYFGVTDLSISNLYIGPCTGAYTGMWPITIDVGNGSIRTSHESYTRLQLDYQSYKAMLSSPHLR